MRRHLPCSPPFEVGWAARREASAPIREAIACDLADETDPILSDRVIWGGGSSSSNVVVSVRGVACASSGQRGLSSGTGPV